MDETKKPEQQEQNTESAPSGERNEELSSIELDQAVGGAITLAYSKVEWVYTQQKPDGTAAAAPDGNKAAK